MAVARLTLRRLRVMATVMLALVVGTAGQIPPAQAAPAGVANVEIILTAQQVGGARTICVGDKVQIRASVVRIQEFEGSISSGPVLGAEIGASMDGSGVGTISPERIATRLDSDSPGAPSFTFTALKPGTATVVFQARVRQFALLGFEFGGRTITTKNTLTVEDCAYKVRTISNFEAQGVKLVAAIDGGMKRNADGSFSGSAIVTWSEAATASGNCMGTISVAPSQVELLGKKVDDQLSVNVGYLPAALVHNFACKGISSVSQAEVIPDPLTFSVSSSGGGERLPHDLYEPNYYSMRGSVVVLVTRVTGR